ncbi:hypothetical protein JOF29_006164 [Kribbella aluminosa]|uniref:Uncharacterized protein n=1 Tax=Kribbella aluminosa TaxID=416017 RepID=A0ABS4UTT3_9ACTN|nr:hypothetical protein [Kribbella aluminosa]MBP2355054.1 hypothetical protein [Kribbella aluminosa]
MLAGGLEPRIGLDQPGEQDGLADNLLPTGALDGSRPSIRSGAAFCRMLAAGPSTPSTSTSASPAVLSSSVWWKYATVKPPEPPTSSTSAAGAAATPGYARTRAGRVR